MALKEDYKDAVFAGLRKYKMLDNGDGTVSPVDMTEYETAGDKFGAKDVNAITKTVNATGEIIADDNDEFKPNQKYEIGRIVIYDNKTWRFKVDHEPGEWDERQVERTNILAVIAEQNKNFDKLNKKIPNPVLLWENPDPTQRFPVDGTIELSSGDYEWLEIYYCSNTTSNGLLYQKVKKGDIPILIHTHFTSSGSGFGYRALQYVDDTHLKGTGYSIRQYFSNNVTPQFDNKATAYGIPVKIYGIK